MKIFMVLSAFFSVIQASIISDLVSELDWDSFKILYHKKYASPHEEQQRKKIYMENKDKIIEHNKKFIDGEVSYTMKLNEYGDLNHTEFLASFTITDGANYTMSGTKGLDLTPDMYVPIGDKELPSEVDWRKRGAVTPARKQGGCGSCWAFTATSAVESHYLKNGRNISFLSPQNLIDCTLEYGNYGCSGGFRDEGFKYIIENGGINTEESYPYEEKEGPCRYNANDIGATLTGFVRVPEDDYQALKEVLANIGPVGAVLDARMETLQFYSSGVYHDPTCRSGVYDLNHDVLVIGYGTENGSDFWIIKNSWGESWGEDGFFKISTANHSCGLASFASYPVITDSGGKISLELFVIINCFLLITVSK